MGDVVILSCVTKLDVPPDRVLESAVGKLDNLIIAGYDKEGNEYFASSYADGGDALWLVERFKIALMRLEEER